MPVLRHDWPSADQTAFSSISGLSGWSPIGLGSPTGYPSSFAIVLLQNIAISILGPYLAHILVTFFIALMITIGAWHVSRTYGQNHLVTLAAIIFSLFNPWVYNKIVAGHVFMLLSYGATLALVGEVSRRRPRVTYLVLLVFPIMAQIQFYVIGFLIYAYAGVRHRQILPTLALCILGLPIWAGVVCNHDVLVTTPYNLNWEIQQSIHFFQAIILQGYSAKYSDALGWLAIASMVIVIVIAAYGFIVRLIERQILTAIAIAIPFIWALGVYGPFYPIFAIVVRNVPEIALFRELYDLLAYLAIGYVVWCSRAALARPYLRIGWLIASGGLLLSWLVRLPSSDWIDARVIPEQSINAPSQTRIAFIPAFQPLRLNGLGSGLDPDVRGYAHDVQPLNEMISTYPTVTAFLQYLENGSLNGLEALSVSRLVLRPWLSIDQDTLQGQVGLHVPIKSPKIEPAKVLALEALPELTIGSLPAVGALDTNVGAGNIFFGDLPSDFPVIKLIHIKAIKTTHDSVSADTGWVDARLAFLQNSAIGQAFGGVITTSRKAMLRIDGARALLVWANGQIYDEHGKVLMNGDSTYHWLKVPAHSNAIMCQNMCVVALAADFLPPYPLNPKANTYVNVPFKSVLGWLLSANIPAGKPALVRYNVRYDAHWAMFTLGHKKTHVRIDAAVNGWLVGSRSRVEHVWIVELGALLTTICEILALVFYGLCFYAAILSLPAVTDGDLKK